MPLDRVFRLAVGVPVFVGLVWGAVAVIDASSLVCGGASGAARIPEVVFVDETGEPRAVLYKAPFGDGPSGIGYHLSWINERQKRDGAWATHEKGAAKTVFESKLPNTRAVVRFAEGDHPESLSIVLRGTPQEWAAVSREDESFDLKLDQFFWPSAPVVVFRDTSGTVRAWIRENAEPIPYDLFWIDDEGRKHWWFGTRQEEAGTIVFSYSGTDRAAVASFADAATPTLKINVSSWRHAWSGISKEDPETRELRRRFDDNFFGGESLFD